MPLRPILRNRRAGPEVGEIVLSTFSPDATLAANLGDPTRARNVGGLTPAAWIRIGVIALLLCSLFWPNLSRLWYKTNPLSTQPDAGNWQHGIFVPLLGLYYLYANRE